VGKRLGLIIGVNNYQDTTFRPLQYAETDARALAQWLVHARGGQWNPADVQVMLGAEATRELAESLISHTCLNLATSEDLLLIYFAGYAFVDQVNGDGYLACSNTRYQQSGSGINLLALVSQIMARSPAAQILCILDCFQYGSVWNMRRTSPFDYKPLLGPTLLNGLQQMQGRLLYCTCRGNETVPEVSEKNLGSFMYRMVMGVGGPAIDPTNGQIALQRLHAFLSERLSEQHRPQVFGQEQRPLILVGEMPVFKTGALTGLAPGGPLPGQMQNDAGIPPGAMPGPSGSGMYPTLSGQLGSAGPTGQATLATLEQNRLQQAQQMLQQAQQLVQMQNLQQAYQVVETILQMAPTFVEALILKGQIMGAIGQFQEALDTVQQVVQLAPNNALGWSMAAALLANTGQFAEALAATDRSLALDPTNNETLAIKEMIREKLAEAKFDTGKRSRLVPPKPTQPRGGPRSVALAIGLQLLGLILGIAGAFLQLLKPDLPKIVPFVVESIALALLTVNAARGAYYYGFKRVLLTVCFTIITLGLLGAFYGVKPIYKVLITPVENSFALMIPLVFLVIWMAAAAILPLLVSIVSWISGAIARSRSKRA
jgi:tetratricopeptide (TPR) repeat protein